MRFEDNGKSNDRSCSINGTDLIAPSQSFLSAYCLLGKALADVAHAGPAKTASTAALSLKQKTNSLQRDGFDPSFKAA